MFFKFECWHMSIMWTNYVLILCYLIRRNNSSGELKVLMSMKVSCLFTTNMYSVCTIVVISFLCIQVTNIAHIDNFLHRLEELKH